MCKTAGKCRWNLIRKGSLKKAGTSRLKGKSWTRQENSKAHFQDHGSIQSSTLPLWRTKHLESGGNSNLRNIQESSTTSTSIPFNLTTSTPISKPHCRPLTHGSDPTSERLKTKTLKSHLMRSSDCSRRRPCSAKVGRRLANTSHQVGLPNNEEFILSMAATGTKNYKGDTIN